MTKLAKCITALVLLFVLLILLWFFLFIQPYILAQNSMPEGSVLTLSEQDDGSLLLSWPKSEEADAYLLEIIGSEGTLYSSYFLDTSCTLPSVPSDEEVTIRVSSQKDYHTPLSSKSRKGDDPIEATCTLSIPSVTGLTSEIHTDTKTISFEWSSSEGAVYHVYTLEDGELTELKAVSGGEAQITFGSDGDLAMLGKDEEATFVLNASRELPGIIFESRYSEYLTITRDDLLGTELELELVDEGHNFYTITWNETRGDGYKLQVLNSSTGKWETIAEYGAYDELKYSTGRLKPYTDYSIRVIATGGVPLPDSEYPAVPDTVGFTTGASAIYATIWPLMDLDVYGDTGKTKVIGTASAATAYCVLDEAEGLFKIFINNDYGYIDSNYCMINLPDYLGNLCSYDIKNSYDAIYMVHEYAIPEITGTVITGYENVLTSTGYLAPLLYPTAQKLAEAALNVREDGYRLKIYDSFRPRQATRFLYDQTLSIINDPLPDDIYAHQVDSEWQSLLDENGEVASLEGDSMTAPTEGNSEEPVTEDEEVEEEERMSYYTLMTNGTYALGHFLARVGSYHNMGIAVDITLEYATSHEELEMQTSMHDLSWYSVVYLNNDNANLLASYMTGAGFATLSSEWWHFQDNELRDSLGLSTYLEQGVTPKGWKADDNGMRYRLDDGTYYANCTITIDGMEYTFDANGYCTNFD